jgi:hypothetical protein
LILKAAAKGAASGGPRLTSILVTVAAPLLLYLILRSALAGLPTRQAILLPPVSEAGTLRRQARDVANPEYKVDQPTLGLVNPAAAAEPLAFEPFFVAARAAEQAKDLPRELALLEEARRRRATWLPIRLLLVRAYFNVGRRGDMAKEIDYILRMNEQARMIMLPELVKLLRYGDTRNYVAGMLAVNPPWKADFFNTARDRRVPPEIVEELLRLAKAQGSDTAQEEQLLVTSLISAGRANEARARWLLTLPPAQREPSRFLYNGDFRSGPAGEFGWTVTALGVGRADLIAAGEQSRMRALYDGGSNAELARQLVALSPGRYRLRVTGRLTSAAGAGQLMWAIRCHPDGPDLLRMPVAPLGEQDRTIEAAFSVAAGCLAQSVRLIGEPGDMSSPVEAEFARIEISNAR